MYSFPVCIYQVKLMLTLYSDFKSEYSLCTERKDLRVLDFVSLCNNWKEAMKLILVLFFFSQSTICHHLLYV